MAIDRIGKPGGAGSVEGGGLGPTAPVGSGAPFEVARTGAAREATDLDRVRAGEVPVSAWIDGRVEAATAHLVDKLPADQLAFVRDSLRRQLTTDPLLADLVKAATGAAPPVEE